ncbi:hypothetical protein ACIOHS_27020 [Streptomyces sp. NPDC088253]|uniref:hypothetical protein n=1 Tax=Streptomyces sp. NPDC088253 TaxID=3365846 RepID=UPI003819A80F
MTTTTALHAKAGAIPVRSASGVLPHYAKEEGARALCGRPSGRRMTEAEADFAKRFCASCVKAAEKLAAANPQQPEAREKPKEREPQLVTAARAFADAIEPGDSNVEINQLAEHAGVDIVHSREGFEPHFAAPAQLETLCRLNVDRKLNDEQTGRISVLCPECEKTGHQRAASLQATRERDQICEMRKKSHAAAVRVRTNPDPTDPEWKAALTELTTTLDWLREHDEVYRLGIEAAEAELAAGVLPFAPFRADPEADATPGSAPKHCKDPDVAQARGALAGLAYATLTDSHDITEPTDEEFCVRGYAVEPRGNGRVAFYWLEGGEAVRRDHPWHGYSLVALADRLAGRGWTVEELPPTAQCVFATAPQPAVPPAANHRARALQSATDHS